MPIEFLYVEEYDRIDSAFYREKQIQNWSKSKKEALIAGDTNKLRELAICLNETTHKNFKTNHT